MSRHVQVYWLILILVCSTVIPRLASIGYYPFLDDGYHAFMAQYVHHSLTSGAGFPKDITGYKLFPLLFNWVWGLPGNALIWLRGADLLFAMLAGWQICRIYIKESGSRAFGLLLGATILCGLNLPGAIQSGFKHSFFPAFACLFTAYEITMGARPKSAAWFWAGVLVALGVLFRETFFPFALLGCVALCFARNYPALWRFIAGGISGALLITLISMLLRGQIYGIFEFYLTYGKIYGPEESRRWLKFIENGGRALMMLSPLVFLFMAALVQAIFLRNRKGCGRAFFWFAAALLPICEPALKIGFLYHFTVCLPGMGGLCAWVFKEMPKGRLKKAGLIATGVACCLLAPELYGHLARAPVTWQTIRNFPAPGWPRALEEKSTTLAAGHLIRDLIPEGGKVSSTGFAYFIFPTSGYLPPEVGLADLSRTWIYSGGNADKFRKRLMHNPPDLALIAHAGADHSEIFEKELKNIFDSMPEYEYCAQVKPDAAKNYGWLGYSLYKRK